jgi:hypothetical protein
MKVTCMNSKWQLHTHKFFGLLLSALIVLLGMAGANPDLHKALHHESCLAADCSQAPEELPDDGEHRCGVTLLQIGALIFSEIPLFESLGCIIEVIERSNKAPFVRAAYHLPQSRAPPIIGLV